MRITTADKNLMSDLSDSTMARVLTFCLLIFAFDFPGPSSANLAMLQREPGEELQHGTLRDEFLAAYRNARQHIRIRPAPQRGR